MFVKLWSSCFNGFMIFLKERYESFFDFWFYSIFVKLESKCFSDKNILERTRFAVTVFGSTRINLNPCKNH